MGAVVDTEVGNLELAHLMAASLNRKIMAVEEDQLYTRTTHTSAAAVVEPFIFKSQELCRMMEKSAVMVRQDPVVLEGEVVALYG